jgi:hypothetical protein
VDVLRMGKRNPDVDRQRQALLQRLDRHIEKELLETEKLLKDYLVAMLNLTHRRLIEGRITLSEYYRDTQMLAYWGQRLNDED